MSVHLDQYIVDTSPMHVLLDRPALQGTIHRVCLYAMNSRIRVDYTHDNGEQMAIVVKACE